MDRLDPIVALLIFVLVVALLFVVVTRGTRAVLGPRRRLEEGVGLAVLEGRLQRLAAHRLFEVGERAQRRAPAGELVDRDHVHGDVARAGVALEAIEDLPAERRRQTSTASSGRMAPGRPPRSGCCSD
jgi:hypothetical protein